VMGRVAATHGPHVTHTDRPISAGTAAAPASAATASGTDG